MKKEYPCILSTCYAFACICLQTHFANNWTRCRPSCESICRQKYLHLIADCMVCSTRKYSKVLLFHVLQVSVGVLCYHSIWCPLSGNSALQHCHRISTTLVQSDQCNTNTNTNTNTHTNINTNTTLSPRLNCTSAV